MSHPPQPQKCSAHSLRNLGKVPCACEDYRHGCWCCVWDLVHGLVLALGVSAAIRFLLCKERRCAGQSQEQPMQGVPLCRTVTGAASDCSILRGVYCVSSSHVQLDNLNCYSKEDPPPRMPRIPAESSRPSSDRTRLGLGRDLTSGDPFPAMC